MQSAFLVFRIFPPPASRSNVFAGFNGTGAGRTANAGEISLVQGVDRDFMRFDVSFHLVFSPVRQRIEFDQARMIPVGARFMDVGSGDALLPTQTCHPGIQF